MSLGLGAKLAIGVILLIVLLVIYFIISNWITNSQENPTLLAAITWHCKEWQDNKCTRESAEKIVIDEDGNYLSDLCEDYIGETWSNDIWKECRGHCPGCAEFYDD